MKRLLSGVLIALAVLALVGTVAATGRSSQASDALPSDISQDSSKLAVSNDSVPAQQQFDLKGNVQTDEDDDADVMKKPFIGISIANLSDEEAEERGIDDGALVKDVLDDGPSAGILENGDVITAINGETVSTSRDVIEIVGDTEPGDEITISILRNDDSQNVIITVGEREHRTITRFFGRKRGLVAPGLPGIPNDLLGSLVQASDKFVRAEIVVEADDGGFKTYRAVAGTVTSDVNDDNTTFDFESKDKQDYTFTINDDTKVILNRDSDIGSLNKTDRTIVISVIENGEENVKLVAQGNLLRLPFPGFGNQGHGGPQFQFRFDGGQFRHGLDGLRNGLQELRERFRNGEGPGAFIERFDGRDFDRDDLPPDVQQFNFGGILERLPAIIGGSSDQ